MKITYNFSTKTNFTRIVTSLALGLLFILQSCKPIQELTPEAKKSEMLIQAKDLF